MPKQKSDRKPPKKPLLAFKFYAKHRRPLLKATQPELSSLDATRLMSYEWVDLDEETRNQYKMLEDEDRKRYILEKKEYEERKAQKKENPTSK
eukprot:snap_masked-scaffold_15-processed-gene-7.4-mRNA-1 protein AED:0.11 eAED:0.11 QI:0/-1/0/1/-1/1/1/0/92